MNRTKKIQQKNSNNIVPQQSENNNEDYNKTYQYRTQQQQSPRSYCYMSFIAICTWILVFILNHMITQQRYYFMNDNNNNNKDRYDVQTMSLLLSNNNCDKLSNHTITTSTITEVDINNGTASTTNSTTTTLSLYESKLLQCNHEYQFIKQYQTLNGLSNVDYQRSRAYYGNPIKLYHLIQKLKTGHHASNVIVCGGSITLGHGIEPKHSRYGDILQVWLNQMFPIINQNPNIQQQQEQHQVHIKGGHGADVSIKNTCLFLIIFYIRHVFCFVFAFSLF